MQEPSKHAPWKPADWTDADAAAIRDMINGEANAEQQKRGMAWIINNLCKTHDMVFRPEGDRDTVFAAAKQFVGQQILALPEKLRIVKSTRSEKDEHA